MDEIYDQWINLKQRLHHHHRLKSFKEREIHWCSVGQNIGTEIYGKNKLFNRPVLILKKYDRFRFIGIPMTSAINDRRFRHTIYISGKPSQLLFDQARCFDVRRLNSLITKLHPNTFKEVQQAYIKHLL